jgi:DNA polymerase III subunit delta
MTEIKAHQVDQALRRAGDDIAVFLIHGPDAGHVSEKARQAAEATKIPLDDPLLCIRAETDVFLTEPGRLLDEARAISMFGGRRLLWLKLGQRNAAPAIEMLLEEPMLEASIILEAGELRAGHTLRTLCEKSEKALSIACYADESDSLERLVKEALISAGKSMESDALASLTASLGADRALTRSELDKLLIYVGDAPQVTHEDVEAVIADAARIEPSKAIDSAFSGQIADVEPLTRRVFEDGLDPGAFLGMAHRHAQALIGLEMSRRDGTPIKEAMKRQGIHFRREGDVARQLSFWSDDRLLSIIGQLGSAIAETRRTASLAPLIAIRTLWTVALAARRSG